MVGKHLDFVSRSCNVSATFDINEIAYFFRFPKHNSEKITRRLEWFVILVHKFSNRYSKLMYCFNGTVNILFSPSKETFDCRDRFARYCSGVCGALPSTFA